VGGAVSVPEKIRDVKPYYPEMAREAKVQGIVIIEAVISSSGDVQEARVLRGHHMLDDAALEAVRQWRYTPPLLNGQPVSVVMTVTVNFTLNDGAGDGSSVSGPSGSIPPPPPPPFAEGILRVGGEITAPRKIFDAAPVYPEAAKAAGVQGIIIAEVLLDVAGNVADIRLLRTNPLLQDAALDAIWQWRYEPALLNGEAVPMVMTVTVNFTLPE
jgi:protein TonB